MPKTLLNIGRCVLIAVLFCAVGGQWLVLQTVAWGKMLSDYSRNAPFTEAVVKTFDGQHPCKICDLILKGQQQEKKTDALNDVKKMDLFCYQDFGIMLVPKVSFLKQPILDCVAFTRTQKPTVPPPRLV